MIPLLLPIPLGTPDRASRFSFPLPFERLSRTGCQASEDADPKEETFMWILIHGSQSIIPPPCETPKRLLVGRARRIVMEQ